MAQPPMYMTVPDKIELTASSVPAGYSGMDQTGGDQRYMKIPDTITLGGRASAPQGGARGMSDGRAIDHNPVQLQAHVEEVTPRDQPAFKRNPGSGEVFEPQPNESAADLEQRIRTLEDKVQDITDVLQSQGKQMGRGNNFWYVLTFAGWMLVPLITVFMYRYKK